MHFHICWSLTEIPQAQLVVSWYITHGDLVRDICIFLNLPLAVSHFSHRAKTRLNHLGRNSLWMEDVQAILPYHKLPRIKRHLNWKKKTENIRIVCKSLYPRFFSMFLFHRLVACSELLEHLLQDASKNSNHTHLFLDESVVEKPGQAGWGSRSVVFELDQKLLRDSKRCGRPRDLTSSETEYIALIAAMRRALITLDDLEIFPIELDM